MFEDRYLGDGVYASFSADTRMICLDLRGQPDDYAKIYLEPTVMTRLIAFDRDIKKALREMIVGKPTPEEDQDGG